MLTGTRVPGYGWSELATTNAPVADEPVEAVFQINENPILPARIIFFFPPLLYPTYHLPPPSYLPSTSPLLPTTYQPLPPHSIARVPETSNETELGAGAWRGASNNRAVEASAGPTREQERDPSKHLTFFFSCFFCLFVCPQVTFVRKKEEEESDDSNATFTFFFLFLCFLFFFFMQRKKKRKKKVTTTVVTFFFLLCNCSAAPRKRQQQPSIVTFFFLLWSFTATPRRRRQ